MAEPFSVPEAYAQIQAALSQVSAISTTTTTTTTTPNALPLPSAVLAASHATIRHLPATGLGPEATLHHLVGEIGPGLPQPARSPHYYGFVTGGVLPVAAAADLLVTAWDQNVQVHLPAQSVATVVEAAALRMLVELLDLRRGDADGDGDGDDGMGPGGSGSRRWTAGTFSTGATASNVLGLACGREEVLRRRLLGRKGKHEGDGDGDGSVAELGLLEACRRAGVRGFQVLTTMGHSSLSKAASIVGLGRASVYDVGRAAAGVPWEFDWGLLEDRLRIADLASVVVVSCGEVNTGRFATGGWDDMRRLRALCDGYGAWLHVDAAFGLFARALPPGEEFAVVRKGAEGIELADSITGDCHKLLNVPYDCGLFLTHSTALLTNIFQNPNAAYLSTNPPTTTNEPNIPSPLNIGLENSRRFRALPVYAVLLAHSRPGLAALFARQVRLARGIARLIARHPAYQLLPLTEGTEGTEDTEQTKQEEQQEQEEQTQHPHTHIIVLFRARDPRLNAGLATRLNRAGRIMVSGTRWGGAEAVRVAVASGLVRVERDLEVVGEVLEGVLRDERGMGDEG